ncbi:MAG TPA: septal ring lytic transglycosylase RlpA family protein, partial [Acidimicrobiales bacterium]|nr:septal ring lytic transglycosylase RlpA family protein [Acidimicrobiales bacterium]
TTTTHVHPSTTTTTVKRATAKATGETTTTTKPKPTTTTTTHVHPSTTTTTTKAEVREQRGLASWYDEAEPGYCAHRTLPKGTKVWVRAVENGKRTSCTVNDRGPYIDGRIIDLSREDFQELTPDIHGLIEVVISW